MERLCCLHRGNTFFGQFEVDESGPAKVIRVHYRDEVMEAKCNWKTRSEVTAYRLLKALIVRDIVRTKAERLAKKFAPPPAVATSPAAVG